jgi:hypothetical protein
MSATTALHTPRRTAYIRLLNCAKKKLATESIIQQATADPQCLALLLQELWNDADCGLPRDTPEFDLFSPTPLHPKCVTYVRRGTPAVQRFTDGDSFLEMVVTVGETSFSLLNFYSPGHPKHIAQMLTTRFPTPPESCILLGDLNAHHPWWSAERDLDSAARRKSSRESNVLAAWLELHRFTLHNEPGIPTHFPDRIGDSKAVPSVIDLALSRGAIRDRVTSWAIDETPPSDHHTIALYLNVGTPAAADPIQYQDWRSTDWRLFDDHIRRMDLDNLEPSGAISAISQGISDAVDTAVPLRTRRTKPQVPWWHPELERISIKRHVPSSTPWTSNGDAWLRVPETTLTRADSPIPTIATSGGQSSITMPIASRYHQLMVPRISRRNATPSGIRCSHPLIPPKSSPRISSLARLTSATNSTRYRASKLIASLPAWIMDLPSAPIR